MKLEKLNPALRRRIEQQIQNEDRAKSAGCRGGSELQKLEENCSDKRPSITDNRPKETKMDGRLHPSYRVSATFLIADERDRDLDGMFSTTQDCLIAATGRLAQMDRLALRKLAKSAERSGGCGDYDRAATPCKSR